MGSEFVAANGPADKLVYQLIERRQINRFGSSVGQII